MENLETAIKALKLTADMALHVLIEPADPAKEP